jgi:hypothetical protein
MGVLVGLVWCVGLVVVPNWTKTSRMADLVLIY